jgi:hypothetical protein
MFSLLHASSQRHGAYEPFTEQQPAQLLKVGLVFRIRQADISPMDYWNDCKRILSLVIMQ